jgi:predicted alpha/beta-hydrolase family hydrolase
VIALSYPLLGPGSPRELLATDLPLLIFQGGNDPYGIPEQFPPLPPETTLAEIPFADHTFRVPTHTQRTTSDVLGQVTETVAAWLGELLATPL